MNHTSTRSKEIIKKIWSMKKYQILRVSGIIFLLITLFSAGMVYADSKNWNYNFPLVFTLFASIIIMSTIGSVLWYAVNDKKYKNKDYWDYAANTVLIRKRQEFILAVYFLLSLIILFVPWDPFFHSTYINGSIFTEFKAYHMLWIAHAASWGVPLLLEIVNLMQYYYRINQTKENVSILKNIIDGMNKGNTVIENPYQPGSEFYELGEGLEQISSTWKEAIDKGMKSERLKVELITNVSHDLKTPLTSVISYIDLMKHEDLSDEMKDYLEILERKSIMLKEMVENLFDLAKTSSGNTELKLETLDMNRLVEQVMADMQDRIKNCRCKWKMDLAKEELPFPADSQAMYRVCQNLIDNAIKYAMEGTRIFVRTSQGKNGIELSVVNTASYEMDFNEDDIAERFVRGDESRTSEGNGLGLAIIKTYTEACGGKLELKIDGDQFKAAIRF